MALTSTVAGTGAPSAIPKPAKAPPPKPKARTPAKRKLASAAAGAGGGPGVPSANPYQARAQAEIDPIIAAITAAAQGQASAADKAIQGLTDSYAQGISGIDYGAPYSSAEAQQAAVDAALQQSATGQGSDLAAALSQRLQALQGSSGANAVNQEAAALANQGAGIGGAQLATGSAALNQLISDAAAAKTYGTKMPGIVRESGLQGIEQAQGQAQQAINQGTLQAESQLPQIEQNLKADAQAVAAAKQEAAYKNATLRATQAYRQAEIGMRQQTLQSENAYRRAELGMRQQTLNSENQYRNAELSLRSQAAKQAWARIGISQKHLQLEAMKSEQSLRGGGYTPIERAHFSADAATIAQNAFHGFTDSKGNVHKPLSYQQAMNEMVQGAGHGTIPPSMAIKALHAAGYTTGVRGTPSKPMNALQKTLGAFAFGAKLTTPAQRTIVNLAHEYMGTPYQWGGESPKGFDCSGFAQYLYGKAGISIPRTTYTQWQAGTPIKQNQMRPGDLVFFKGSDSRGGLPGHVGIYIGGGKMIDAPHTGSDVRIDNVSSFGGYMGARRYGKG